MSSSETFQGLGLPVDLTQTLTDLQYTSPTPIQSAAIPALLEGRDLLGQAETGTGKTAAFVLPLLCRLNLKRPVPQVLVLTPTRELAIQVSDAFRRYARGLKGFRVLPVYGGQAYPVQLKALRRGVHVVVGTPGRILDHLRRGSLKLEDIGALVLDEGDEMLRMGFVEDVEAVISGAPDGCQLALFSATMPGPMRRIARRHLKEPREIKIASKTNVATNVDQRFLLMRPADKFEVLTRVLEVEPHDGVLIFVRTKTATVDVAQRLQAYGFSAAAMNGDMTQASREQTIQRLKDCDLNIVVATDVAARGLDVQRLSLVINYDIPYDVEPYIHRIGRTGRAGRSGKAILFVTPREQRLLRSIERVARKKIERMKMPRPREIEKRRAQQFQDRVTDVFAKQPLDFFFQHLQAMQAELNVSLEQLAPALLYLAQAEQPLQLEKGKKGAESLDVSGFEEPRRKPRKKGFFSRPRRKNGSASRPRNGRARHQSS